ncbi:hypothetical protein [Actinospica robiniae]|uniref:hypothetical protein n=1 Tax=Actinospica robiniae TaxID=304901 RepID=UPI0012F73E87|nr:hypothetical protein [Actinospica robiniae]
MAIRGSFRCATCVVAALAFTAGCSPSSSQSAVAHHNYSYQAVVEPSPWHAGDLISVTWTPQNNGSVTNAAPAQLRLAFVIYGPFSSVAELKRVMAGPSSAWPEPAANGRTVTADSWSGTTTHGTLQLPKDLKPGLYDTRQQVSVVGGGASSGDGIVTVVG